MTLSLQKRISRMEYYWTKDPNFRFMIYSGMKIFAPKDFLFRKINFNLEWKNNLEKYSNFIGSFDSTLEMGIYALKGRFDEYHFSEIPFAVPVEPVQGVPTKVQGLDGWPDDKIPRNIRYRVTLMESAMELCRQGHCASYLPHFIVRLHNERILEKYLDPDVLARSSTHLGLQPSAILQQHQQQQQQQKKLEREKKEREEL
jgi:hypothetical protein